MTTALVVHMAALVGPRKLAPAQLTVDDAWCQALFASTLQRSDAPGADAVAEAIRVTVQQLGANGFTGRMAQEFGDHPEAAAERIRWVRSLLSCPLRRSPPRGRKPRMAAASPARAMQLKEEVRVSSARTDPIAAAQPEPTRARSRPAGALITGGYGRCRGLLIATAKPRRVGDQRGPPGYGMIGLVTRRGVSRPGAGVLASCISAGACSRACRHQTGQRGLCRVHDG
jgi:hypothetical protein